MRPDAETVTDPTDLAWSGGTDRIVLSPRNGGRIVSWKHAGTELVHPLVLLEGGLFRVLFAEEQYPGSSWVAAHEVIDRETGPDGFRVHLRHYWNLPNGFMRMANWPEKVSELHIDGLVLDKTFTYSAHRGCIECTLAITNTGHETKYLTPWVHLAFNPWPRDRWVVTDGRRDPYEETEIYWGGHVCRKGSTIRLVHAGQDGTMHAFLGAATDHLRGVCGMLPVPGEFAQSSSELRYDTVELAPGTRFCANSFLAMTPDAHAFDSSAPVDLYCRIEPASNVVADPSLSLLENWMLPEEKQRGLMVLSFLDKPPFFSGSRFFAANSFGGFHLEDSKARAHVMLYACRALQGVTAEVTGPAGWRLRGGTGGWSKSVSMDPASQSFVPLQVEGTGDLRGKSRVKVALTVPGSGGIALVVDPGSCVEPRYTYQVRQSPAYMDERYREKLSPRPGATAEEFTAWRERMRRRWRQWLEFNAAGPCDLEPRMVERQEGRTCVREKWLIQTEPGIWVPGFLVRPRNARGRLPVLFHLHGSGPGKDGYAGDEVDSPPRTQWGNELEYMPYHLARELGCLVYVPDGRGQGELGETDPGRWGARMAALGVSNVGLRLLDQIRALDWLAGRDDVDPSRIGSLGCSGGGGMTYLFAAADERVTTCIVSSTGAATPARPAPPGYFHRMLMDRSITLQPHGIEPIGIAPAGMLIAPRPMWIFDGLDDLGIPPEKRVEWRRTMQEGRDAIRRVYRLLGVEDHFEDTWFEGGHCAGMTNANAIAWFRRWFDKQGRL